MDLLKKLWPVFSVLTGILTMMGPLGSIPHFTPITVLPWSRRKRQGLSIEDDTLPSRRSHDS